MNLQLTKTDGYDCATLSFSIFVLLKNVSFLFLKDHFSSSIVNCRSNSLSTNKPTKRDCHNFQISLSCLPQIFVVRNESRLNQHDVCCRFNYCRRDDVYSSFNDVYCLVLMSIESEKRLIHSGYGYIVVIFQK